MYFEEATVKEYQRKGSKPNKQLNLGVNSRFKKKDKVIVISSENLKTFKENLEPKVNELESKLSSCRNENQRLQEELQQLKLENERLSSERVDFIEETNKKLLEAKAEIEARDLELIQLQKEQKQDLEVKANEIRELNNKLANEKDTSKTLLVGLYAYEERGLLDKWLDRTPALVKEILKENPKPIETTSKE